MGTADRRESERGSREARRWADERSRSRDRDREGRNHSSADYRDGRHHGSSSSRRRRRERDDDDEADFRYRESRRDRHHRRDRYDPRRSGVRGGGEHAYSGDYSGRDAAPQSPADMSFGLSAPPPDLLHAAQDSSMRRLNSGDDYYSSYSDRAAGSAEDAYQYQGDDRGRGYSRARAHESGSSDEDMAGAKGQGHESNTIVIKGLADSLTEADVANLMSDIPTCRDVRMLRNRRTGVSGGMAFLDFDDHEAASAAWSGPLREKIGLLGRSVTLDWAQRSSSSQPDWTCLNCSESNYHRRERCYRCRCPKGERDTQVSTTTIRITGLDPQTTEADLSYVIKPIAAATSIRIVRDKFTQVPKGIAFVSFATPEDAEAARRTLNGTSPSPGAPVLSITFARDRFPRSAGAASAADAVAAAQAMNSTYASRKPQPDAPASNAADAWQPMEFDPALAGIGQTESATIGSTAMSTDAEAQMQQPAGQDGALPSDATDTGGVGFVYDATSGYYYDATSGYYYDANTQLYYHPSTNEWYYHNTETGQYEAVPQQAGDGVDDAAPGVDASADGAATVEAATTAAASSQQAAVRQNVAATIAAAPSVTVKKVSRRGAVLGASAELNPEGLLAHKESKNAVVEKAPSVARPAAAATSVDSHAVAEWLRRKNEEQAQKAAARMKKEPLAEQAPLHKQAPQTPAPESMPPPAAKPVCTTAIAGGGRIREKVYCAIEAVQAAPGHVQGKIYKGKYS